MNKNYLWILAALIVGVVIGMYFPKGNTLNKKNIENIINTKIAKGSNFKVEDIKNFGNISEVKIDLNGQKDSLFVSDNGKVFFAKVVDLEELEKQEKTTQSVKKVIEEAKSLAGDAKFVKKDDSKAGSDEKPKVELFVMSHCPYGTQTEKGYLPAVQKLGDKIDAKVKFVNYVMHPSKFEGEENLLQYCIQETQAEKYNKYLGCFLKEGNTSECVKDSDVDLKLVGACLNETDKNFAVSENLNDKSKWLNGRFPKFNIQDDLNKKYKVQGSPTLVINGKQVQTGRDANSIFKAICSAFKTQPEECKETLSTESPAPGFGYDNSGAQNNSESGCGA